MKMKMSSQRGFSLIELLVAMSVTLIVLGLAVRAFSDALTADEAVRLMADSNQNLQASSTMVVRDLMDAGRGIPIGGVALPSGVGAVNVNRPGPPLAVAAGFPGNLKLQAITPGDELGPTIEGMKTDVVTILQVDDQFPEAKVSSIAIAGGTATITLDSTHTETQKINTSWRTTLKVGDLFLFTGDNQAFVRVTEYDDGNKYVLKCGDDTNATMTMGFNQFGAASGSAAGVTGTDRRLQRVSLITYYVDQIDGVPYLMRQRNDEAPIQVGYAVTNLQMAYDVNTGAGGVQIVNMPPIGFTAANFDQAYVSLAVRSDQKFRKTGSHLRNDVTTQVALRSLQLKTNYEFDK